MLARPSAFLGRLLAGLLVLSGGPAFALDIHGEYDPPLGRVSAGGDGVARRVRDDLAGALEWYKEALAVGPDLGGARDDMACVYALEGRKGMALRYLQIAALDGHAAADGVDAGAELEPLRAAPGSRALVHART